VGQDDVVALPAVTIPPLVGWEGTIIVPSCGLFPTPVLPLPISNGMASLPGGEWVVGDAADPGLPPHTRRIDPFFLDQTEVTVSAYWLAMKSFPPASPRTGLNPAQAMAYVSYDEAVACAERLGKRLPDEFEYEFAATGGGTQRFPWGDDFRAMADVLHWPFGPVGEGAGPDRTRTLPPIFGLYSNVGEWTSSWATPYPGALSPGSPFPPPGLEALYRDLRIVRGTPFSPKTGNEPDASRWEDGPCQRQGVSRQFSYPWLGFRCARSARPRFLESESRRVQD
jgi:formylglycine-generating enzyme required for sulfatase activity